MKGSSYWHFYYESFILSAHQYDVINIAIDHAFFRCLRKEVHVFCLKKTFYIFLM